MAWFVDLLKFLSSGSDRKEDSPSPFLLFSPLPADELKEPMSPAAVTGLCTAGKNQGWHRAEGAKGLPNGGRSLTWTLTFWQMILKTWKDGGNGGRESKSTIHKQVKVIFKTILITSGPSRTFSTSPR